MAGHTLAATLLHVTGARHVLRRDPDEAERALEEAEAVGRDGLDQVRATVAALRTAERGTDPPLADGQGLADLVDRYRTAGLTVVADLDPAIDDLTGPVAVACPADRRRGARQHRPPRPDQRVTVGRRSATRSRPRRAATGAVGRRPDRGSGSASPA